MAVNPLVPLVFDQWLVARDDHDDIYGEMDNSHPANVQNESADPAKVFPRPVVTRQEELLQQSRRRWRIGLERDSLIRGISRINTVVEILFNFLKRRQEFDEF